MCFIKLCGGFFSPHPCERLPGWRNRGWRDCRCSLCEISLASLARYQLALNWVGGPIRYLPFMYRAHMLIIRAWQVPFVLLASACTKIPFLLGLFRFILYWVAERCGQSNLLLCSTVILLRDPILFCVYITMLMLSAASWRLTSCTQARQWCILCFIVAIVLTGRLVTDWILTVRTLTYKRVGSI
jgi:hypothetical protein